MGSVYQRTTDGRWVAAVSHGPRHARETVVRYANSEAEARAILATMEPPPPTRSERFWRKVDKSGDCWEWQGFRVRGLYGVFWDGSRRTIASRFAYEDVVGPVPAGQYVLHRCDNPPCCRPDHLFLGTLAENYADMVAKGRAHHQKSTGATR